MRTFIKTQINLLKSMSDNASESNNFVQMYSSLNTAQHTLVDQDHNQTIDHPGELLSLHCTLANYVT